MSDEATDWELMDMDDLLDAAHDGDVNAGLEIAVREVKTLRANLEAVKGELRGARELLQRFHSEGRSHRLRLALFEMHDAREMTSAAGFTLTIEAKAKLYDIQQDIIRDAIAADDNALALPSPAEPADPVAAILAVECPNVSTHLGGEAGRPCHDVDGPGVGPDTVCLDRIRAAQPSKTGEGTR